MALKNGTCCFLPRSQSESSANDGRVADRRAHRLRWRIQTVHNGVESNTARLREAFVVDEAAEGMLIMFGLIEFADPELFVATVAEAIGRLLTFLLVHDDSVACRTASIAVACAIHELGPVADRSANRVCGHFSEGVVEEAFLLLCSSFTGRRAFIPN